MDEETKSTVKEIISNGEVVEPAVLDLDSYSYSTTVKLKGVLYEIVLFSDPEFDENLVLLNVRVPVFWFLHKLVRIDTTPDEDYLLEQYILTKFQSKPLKKSNHDEWLSE